MKLTKIKILTLMLVISPSISANQLPGNVSKFFNNIISSEREKLIQCIQNEGLVGKEIINTSSEKLKTVINGIIDRVENSL